MLFKRIEGLGKQFVRVVKAAASNMRAVALLDLGLADFDVHGQALPFKVIVKAHCTPVCSRCHCPDASTLLFFSSRGKPRGRGLMLRGAIAEPGTQRVFSSSSIQRSYKELISS
jgi:hypothetical protein